MGADSGSRTQYFLDMNQVFKPFHSAATYKNLFALLKRVLLYYIPLPFFPESSVTIYLPSLFADLVGIGVQSLTLVCNLMPINFWFLFFICFSLSIYIISNYF